MAFTITDQQVAIAIRAVPNADEPVPAGVALTLDFMIGAAKEMITRYAPGAPTATANMALIRLAGFFYDQDPNPDFSRSASSSNALQFSGAASILSQWRVHRAGAIDGFEGIEPAPTPGGDVPEPPSQGHFILTSNSGQLVWVEFPAP